MYLKIQQQQQQQEANKPNNKLTKSHQKTN